MEQLRCYTLCFDAVGDRFDTSLMDRELRGREVDVEDVSVFRYDGLPRLNLLLRVRDPDTARRSRKRHPMLTGARSAPSAEARGAKEGPRTTKQWRERLRPAEQPLFDRLSQWRATTARGLGAPAFLVLTNRALAGLASMRPTSEEELLQVPGVGSRTVEKHGDALRQLIVLQADSGQPDETVAGSSETAH